MLMPCMCVPVGVYVCVVECICVSVCMCVCVCSREKAEGGRVREYWVACVYAVTLHAAGLPLIPISRRLSDASQRQGFHSTTPDTQTH